MPRVAAWKKLAARGAGIASRRVGRGGTSLPGKVLMRLEPDAISGLAASLSRGSVVISATNGKTTTAAMVSSILELGGARLVHNRAGANMAGGVASALLEGDGDLGLFEVDEFWLDRVVPQLRPRALLLANLFRDQLDRYGELETIADRWALVATSTTADLVLNADDPLVADLGRQRDDAVYFGVQDTSLALSEMQHAADAKHCRRCGAPYRYEAILLGHLGHYHCDSCGATRPTPSVAATDVVLDGVRGARFTLRTPSGDAAIELPLPGLYNVYNALAAAALAQALGAPIAAIAAGLHAVAPAFGRAERLVIGGRDVLLLLVKNPAGANEVLRTLLLEDGEHDLFAVLNDNTADGRDISWIWDADFEVLAPRVRSAVCSGTRSEELALRLKYAGVPPERLIVEPDLGTGLDRALAGGSGPLYALPTYTAMLALREVLVGRGVAGELVRMSDAVLWHDIECGAYDVDLPLWREFAQAAGGPILDVGAGTGRVTLDLAGRGYQVVALDIDDELLAALADRTVALPVETVVADAATFSLGRTFALIVVPMQTVQLLGGDGRRAFLRCAAAHLSPGGLLAIALADALESFDSAVDTPPLPDLREIDGWVYASRPLAVVDEGTCAAIHRLREIVAPDGARTEDADVIRLDRIDAAALEAEAADAGLRSEPARRVPQTDDYVGSTVVLLRG